MFPSKTKPVRRHIVLEAGVLTIMVSEDREVDVVERICSGDKLGI
jgi:hypothetical protein